MFEQLRRDVCRQNQALVEHGLVVFTWGNVSAIDRGRGVVAIKPSGVAYQDLTAEMIVLVDLEGTVVEGDLRPSSDTPTHLELYRSFVEVGGICHTHSRAASAWAQAAREIPCFGTTHADFFHGSIPLTDPPSSTEIAGNYERATGTGIVRRFSGLDPMAMPAVLVAHHGPFTWGRNAAEAVTNAAALEHIASMALDTLIINAGATPIANDLLNKHFFRKHGASAYYGQAKEEHT
jgi:L-ribulose-5-phosphate 4-epimerase